MEKNLSKSGALARRILGPIVMAAGVYFLVSMPEWPMVIGIFAIALGGFMLFQGLACW